MENSKKKLEKKITNIKEALALYNTEFTSEDTANGLKAVALSQEECWKNKQDAIKFLQEQSKDSLIAYILNGGENQVINIY